MKKIRLAFDFSEEAKERLDELVEKTGAANRAEVVRLALKLYDEAIHVIPERHSAIIIRDGNDFTVK